ncbi:hypothetical protein [Clostridium isatidis]|uniref:hypothetical protein n=1 Tax=Clostridium isatidis TaxID=182773 RepID=UPI000E706B4A|nr:hypothetical protein [Clostridium isatidis]NLZ34195.1 hypothetical protein [Clostridiales bacterium]
MKKIIKIMSTIMLIMLSLNLKSCETKKDNYFDYLKNSNVELISIQNVRDKSFKFLMTDKKAINNMSDLLSKAEVSETKSDLDPDYIFQIKIGDKIEEYNYIVGDYNGNFYNDERIFTMPKRLDEAIMQNLSIIRKPRDFEYIYYNTILDTIKLNKEQLTDKKVGIDIYQDIDCLKYILSSELKEFINNAKEILPNVELVEKDTSNFDVVIGIKNRGHSTTVYKSNIKIENKIDKSEDNYYVIGEYEFNEWDYKVYHEKEVPREIKNKW